MSRSECDKIKVMKSIKRIDFSLGAVEQLGHQIPEEVLNMRALLEIMEKCDRNPSCKVIVEEPDGTALLAKYDLLKEEWFTLNI